MTAAGNVAVTGNVSAANVVASSAAFKGFFGNGRSINDLSADNITAGTLNNARLDQNLSVTSLATTANIVVGGDAVITGNLMVKGDTTTVNTTQLDVQDAVIALGNVLNSTQTYVGTFGRVYGTASNVAAWYNKSGSGQYEIFTTGATSDADSSGLTTKQWANLRVANVTADLYGNVTTANLTVVGNATINVPYASGRGFVVSGGPGFTPLLTANAENNGATGMDASVTIGPASGTYGSGASAAKLRMQYNSGHSKSAIVDFGHGYPGRDTFAGVMGYGAVSGTMLDIVGAGISPGLRVVNVWDKLGVNVGTTVPTDTLQVNGNAAISGNVSAANVVAATGAGKGFFGNGININDLSATNITTGTLDNARLPAAISVTSLATTGAATVSGALLAGPGSVASAGTTFNQTNSGLWIGLTNDNSTNQASGIVLDGGFHSGLLFVHARGSASASAGAPRSEKDAFMLASVTRSFPGSVDILTILTHKTVGAVYGGSDGVWGNCYLRVDGSNRVCANVDQGVTVSATFIGARTYA